MSAERTLHNNHPVELEQISNLRESPLLVPHKKNGAEADFSSLSPYEIIERGLEIQRMEIIDPNSIELDQAIVDEHHASELNTSMNKKRGQLNPVVVRARLDEQGNLRYDVADGFHRTSGVKAAGKNEIIANVMYGCSDTELYDVRILSAGSVKSVQFARVAQWMQESFEHTPYAKKIKVTQAFAIAINDSQRTRGGIALDQEEIQGVKDWVKDRCDKWSKSPKSAYQILRLVDLADPEIVKLVRNASSGDERKAVVTTEKLRHVVEKFPGEENFHIQRLILSEVTNRQLSPTDTALLTLAFKKKYQPWMTDLDISLLLNKIDLSSIVNLNDTGSTPSVKRAPIRVDEHRERRSRSGSRRRTEHVSSFDTEVSARRSAHEPLLNTMDHSDVLAIAVEKIDTLGTEKESLEEELAKAKEDLARLTWWRNQEAGLTSNERTVLEYILFDRKSITAISERLELTPKEVIQVFGTGIGKGLKSK